MPSKATFVLFSDKLVWPHLEVAHWFALNCIKNIYFVICFFYLVFVTYCMSVLCYLCTNPIPSGIPLPGRTAHRTAGINLGSAGPRPNIKGNIPNSGFEPEGSTKISPGRIWTTLYFEAKNWRIYFCNQISSMYSELYQHTWTYIEEQLEEGT